MYILKHCRLGDYIFDIDNERSFRDRQIPVLTKNIDKAKKFKTLKAAKQFKFINKLSEFNEEKLTPSK